MKKILLPLFMIALFSFTGTESRLTEAERKMAVSELTKSSEHLLGQLEGLSKTQLDFKTGPDSWSIAECTEHIAISENNIFSMLQATLKTDPEPEKRDEVKVSDDQLIAMIVDRSNKVKTQESFEPTGKFGSHAETIKEFNTRRAEHIKYVQKTEDDLRNRYQPLPFGTIDAFQIILFMSAHTERHVKQIEEIKASEDFPKK